jgi:hypothetical protein
MGSRLGAAAVGWFLVVWWINPVSPEARRMISPRNVEDLLCWIAFWGVVLITIRVLLTLTLSFERLQIGPAGVFLRRGVPFTARTRHVPLSETRGVAHQPDRRNYAPRRYGIGILGRCSQITFGHGADEQDRIALGDLVLERVRELLADHAIDPNCGDSAEPHAQTRRRDPADDAPAGITIEADAIRRDSKSIHGLLWIAQWAFVCAVCLAGLVLNGQALYRHFGWIELSGLLFVAIISLGPLLVLSAAIYGYSMTEIVEATSEGLVCIDSVLGWKRTRVVPREIIKGVERYSYDWDPGLRESPTITSFRDGVAAPAAFDYDVRLIGFDGTVLDSIDSLTEQQANCVEGKLTALLTRHSHSKSPVSPAAKIPDELWDRELDVPTGSRMQS